MLNQTGIKREKYLSTNQILFATAHQVSVSIRVAKDETNKIIKAGTPMAGNLDERQTGFTVANTDGTDVIGILLHDVDVSIDDANATLLLFGFVNTNRIDTAVKAKLTTEVKKALPMIKMMAC